MNRPQKLVVLVAVVIVAGMMLFPPWRWYRNDAPLGFSSLFFPPDRASVDTTQLALQCAAVAVLAFGALVALARKSDS